MINLSFNFVKSYEKNIRMKTYSLWLFLSDCKATMEVKVKYYWWCSLSHECHTRFSLFAIIFRILISKSNLRHILASHQRHLSPDNMQFKTVVLRFSGLPSVHIFTQLGRMCGCWSHCLINDKSIRKCLERQITHRKYWVTKMNLKSIYVMLIQLLRISTPAVIPTILRIPCSC